MTPVQRESVRQRAGGRCEYCRLPDSALDSADFHVEHIVARKHGGSDNEDNLAWACIFCNLYKGPNLASLDPDTAELTLGPSLCSLELNLEFTPFPVTGKVWPKWSLFWALPMFRTPLTC